MQILLNSKCKKTFDDSKKRKKVLQRAVSKSDMEPSADTAIFFRFKTRDQAHSIPSLRQNRKSLTNATNSGIAGLCLDCVSRQ